MPKCNLMLFAAGLGTRLRPYTEINPKPTIPLLGIPLGFYLFPYFKALDIQKFVVNTFHLPEKIHQQYLAVNNKIKFSDEKDFIKGSAGGLKQAEDLLNTQHTVVCNSDEVLFTAQNDFISQALMKHINENALATLVVMKHPEAGKKFGAIWTDEKGKVVHIGKVGQPSKSTPWHFVGVQILSSEVYKHIPSHQESNIFYDVLIHLLQNNLVQIYVIEADWYETGNLVDYTVAKRQISEKLKTQEHYQKHFELLNKLPRSQISDLS